MKVCARVSWSGEGVVENRMICLPKKQENSMKEEEVVESNEEMKKTQKKSKNLISQLFRVSGIFQRVCMHSLWCPLVGTSQPPTKILQKTPNKMMQ